MKKIFTLIAAALFATGMWAETVTMDCALAKGSTPSPSIGTAILNGGAFDGSGYKLGSDGNYIGWNIAAAEKTFTAVSFNGYINTTNTEKNWAFQFSTDGGSTWGSEVTQANDGTKSYHDINVNVTIPNGANAIRIIRRAGTSSYVSSITLTLAGALTTYTITYKANGGTGDDVVDSKATTVASNSFSAPDGKAFSGWNTAADGTGDAYAVGASVTSDLTLYAQWVDVYSVTYKANGGTGNDIVADNPATIATCTFIAPTGKGFKEWNTAADGKGTSYAPGTAVSSTLVLYAIWQKAPQTIFQWTKGNGAQITEDNTDLNSSNMGSMTTGTSVVARKLGSNNIDNNNAGYKLGNNDVCIEIQGTAAFQEGDTVIITGQNGGSGDRCFAVAPSSTTDAVADTVLTNTIGSAIANSVYKVVLKSAQEGTKLRVFRKAGSTMYLKSIKVIAPARKDIVSSDTTLTGVTVNGAALSSDSLTELLTKEWIALKGTFVAQPTIVYTKHVVITYDDDSQAEKNVNVTVPIIDDPDEPEDYWLATDTIGGVAYDIYIEKELSYRAVYFYGTDTIGVENIALGGRPDVAYYGAITTGIPALSVIDAWYEDAELTQSITPGKYSQSTTADKNFYASVAYKYASSINFEELIMENGKSYASVNQLGTRNYASNYGSTGMDVSNDSLDNSKPKRNYPYLGLKVKTAGALLNFRLAAGKTVKIKFGNVPTVPQVSVNGGDYANITITNGVYTHTAEAEELISLKHMSGSMVFQQIAIDEELADPELFAITCTEPEHGTIGTAYQMGIPGEIVAVSVVRDGGYKATSVTANGDEIESLSETTYQFTMPAADVTVDAVFSVATGVDNTEVEGKAVKRLVNGQLVIEKNGKTYTVTGLEVR